MTMPCVRSAAFLFLAIAAALAAASAEAEAVTPSLTATATGYALEFPADGLGPRPWHTFSSSDFYGSLSHVGSTPAAIHAFDTAADGSLWYIRAGADWGTLDATGVASSRGAMQSDADYTALLDLAIDPRSGAAYVATIKNVGDTATSKLYSLNLATGVMTPIGTMGSGWITAIAIDCQGRLYGEDVATQMLYRIDTSDGSSTVIGATGIAAQYEQGLSFDRSDGTLYSSAYFGSGQNAWGQFDTATGAFTQIAQNPQRPGHFKMKLSGACASDTLFVDGFDSR